MERRALLRSATLGVTIGLLPAWMRRAFADDADACEERSALLVRAALEHARRRGFPLLVLVAPTDPDRRRERPGLFGELIDQGPPLTLATLALAEVVCATVGAVRCVVPATPVERAADPPLFLLVETSSDHAVVTTLYADILPWRERGWQVPGAELAEWHRTVRSHIRRMTTVLRRALAGPDLLRRAAQNMRALPKADGARVLAAAPDGGASLPLDLVDAGAPLLFASALAMHDGEARERAVARLATAARRRLRDHAPPGGRWWRWEGCASCGLSAVSLLSRRFLDFDVAREP
jgi:hypothetical protein